MSDAPWAAWARRATIVVAALAAGCAAPLEPSAPACDDAALESGRSYFYVMNLLALAGPEGDAPPFTSVGFNIDGDAVVACNGHIVGESAEFAGQDPDNGSGIDNAFGGDLGNEVNAVLQGNIDAGSTLILVEVRGVDDLANDSCVEVSVFPGALPAGTTVPMTDGAGRLAAGQTFDILPATFSDPSRIIDGRVESERTAVPLTLPLLGPGFPVLHLRAPQVRFDISADGISRGVFGGSMDTEEVITALIDFPLPFHGWIFDIRSLRGLADLDEDGNPSTCEAASVALKFSGVTAL